MKNRILSALFGRIAVFVPLILLFTLIIYLLIRDPYGHLYARDNIDRLYGQVLALVEEEYGQKLSHPPKVEIKTLNHLRYMIMSRLDEVESICLKDSACADNAIWNPSEQARFISSSTAGKFVTSVNEIWIIKENINEFVGSPWEPVLLSDNYLRAVIIQELVHALDEQEYEIERKLRRSRSINEYSIMATLQMGHARYLGDRIVERADKDWYGTFNNARSKINGENNAEDYGARYIRSREIDGKPPRIGDIFNNPPGKIEDIYPRSEGKK